ncbi:hypothetical protein FB451DRAFT_1165159 [Mycena latifolia]|nr:hypothetical protein FB451DRAFT_1165159 [Mycena latifolia]
MDVPSGEAAAAGNHAPTFKARPLERNRLDQDFGDITKLKLAVRRELACVAGKVAGSAKNLKKKITLNRLKSWEKGAFRCGTWPRRSELRAYTKRRPLKNAQAAARYESDLDRFGVFDALPVKTRSDMLASEPVIPGGVVVCIGGKMNLQRNLGGFSRTGESDKNATVRCRGTREGEMLPENAAMREMNINEARGAELNVKLEEVDVQHLQTLTPRHLVDSSGLTEKTAHAKDGMCALPLGLTDGRRIGLPTTVMFSKTRRKPPLPLAKHSRQNPAQPKKRHTAVKRCGVFEVNKLSVYKKMSMSAYIHTTRD